MLELLMRGQPRQQLGRCWAVPEVYSIEAAARPAHDRARENGALALANVHLLFGDGMAGFAKGARPTQPLFLQQAARAISSRLA
jgi:protein-L-isoaspartate O-methyltransferase